MSDTMTAAPAEPAAIQIQINAQYTKDFSFENPNAPASLQPKEQQPSIAVNVDVSANRVTESDLYEVVLKINADAKRDTEQLFLAELTYAGLFTIKNVPQEQVTPLLLIECPRLLFPFARNIMAEATRDGGFPPLLIQPVDFAAMFRQSAANQAAATEASGTAAVVPPED
jgi:preprotein translocase subunit SecB